MTIETQGIAGGLLTLGGAQVSSQYLSALLMASPMAKTPLEIQTAVPVSRPYVDMTCGLMARFGVSGHSRRLRKVPSSSSSPLPGRGPHR